MKRFISALAFCSLLLVLLSFILFPPTSAKENTLMALLNLPAPPPPNPLVTGASRERDPKFYDLHRPPSDDAPIADLIDYWTRLSSGYRNALYYNPTPSDRTIERLTAEMSRRPALAGELLKILPDTPATVNAIRALYDQSLTAENGLGRDQQKELREWLKFNSPQFSGDLERIAAPTVDENGYVDLVNENNLLALTKHDFDKARPILDRMYADTSQPVTRVLATWALYENAMSSGALGDVERYRSELMRLVEDRTESEGVRDKANDALTHGRDFPGRDEWTISLFEDETLVNMPRFTMLTTLIMYSPPEKFVPKMIELIERSSNKTVRSAAVANLLVALNRGVNSEMERQIIMALLPWLEDPKWLENARPDAAGFADTSRGAVVQKLSDVKIPESVPGLIEVLNETEKRTIPYGANVAANSNMNSNVVPRLDRLTMIGGPNTNAKKPNGVEVLSYPYRDAAVAALKKQADARAIPALRRLLPEGEGYERGNVVGALLASGGFSVADQLAALETAAKGVRDDIDAEEAIAGGADSNTVYERRYLLDGSNANVKRAPTVAEINALLGQQLLQQDTISDELARGIVDRIEALDTKDGKMAAAYRRMILRWQNSAINLLLLRDVKRDIADIETILRLLSQRKHLRETMSSDVADLRNGKPAAIGIAGCLLEDAYDYAPMLESANAETKTALLACARLIRAPLPIASVAANLSSTDKMLVIAAERYLESEDSVEARNIVLGRHPGEAKILGATSAFFVEGVSHPSSSQLWELYKSIGNNALYNGWAGSGNDEALAKKEERLREEAKKDDTLVGVYAYQDSYVRIYKDRTVFSWDEDDSRYRERPLTKYEFDELKAYLETNRVDELPPFLSCGGEYCEARELVMLGRNGGRRVYMNGEPGEFFAGLDKYFADLKKTPATLKYALSREIPGLELLLATDDLNVETVWKEAADLRVAASLTSARKAVDKAIDNVEEEAAEDGEDFDYEAREAKRSAIRDKRQYEGFGWYSVSNGQATTSTQPPLVTFIPLRDSHSVQPTAEQWKTRAGDVEIRTSGEGLFKLSRGRLTKVRPGSYGQAVITPNGRWAVAAKSTDDGPGIVRVDLVTSREFPVELEGYGNRQPVAYIPTLKKILVVRSQYYDYDHDWHEDGARTDPSPEAMILIDAATGATQPIAGEFRPLAQQTFRPLQKAAKLNEFWAAIPDFEKNETEIGVFETKTFGWTPVLKVPKIAFNSMATWVDEAGNKVYFVYRGHLLALPLRK